MPRDTAQPAASPLTKKNFAIVFGISCAIQIGNTGLISVIPPISRSIGLPDELAVAIFSLSALAWVVTSSFWAKACDRYGQKPLMIVGLCGFLASMTLCGLVVSAGIRHMAAIPVIFVSFLLSRGLFGFVGSAANPATQSYVAQRTTAAARTQAMSSLAGAVGLGQVAGPFLAPLFILPLVGLAGPLFGFAAIAGAMLLIVWTSLPDGDSSAESRGETNAWSGPPMWRDRRVTPFLIYAVAAVACQIGQQQSLGFLVLDKLQVSPLEAQHALAIAMMFGAIAGLLAQWGLIPMLSMTPRQLLRWGVVVAGAGNLTVALAPNYFWVVSGYALASLGFGMARPGFTAGSSLAVGMSDQARVAGAIAATTGVAAATAPLFMALYRYNPTLPYFMSVATMAGLFAYTLISPTLRNAAPTPAGRDDATTATLERVDEGV